MMNWLRKIFSNKKNKKKSVKTKSNYKSGGIIGIFDKPSYGNIDMSDSIHVLSRPFGEAVWFNDSKQNILPPSEQYLERLKYVNPEIYEREYFNVPVCIDEDRRIDDSQDKVISEEREIHQSWIDDSYNTPTDSTSYDSSSSYDDSSTSSGDW